MKTARRRGKEMRKREGRKRWEKGEKRTGRKHEKWRERGEEGEGEKI